MLDGAGSTFSEDGGYGRPPKRLPRRAQDDKVHDSIIEERIQRERPCRTLFIRNIKASPISRMSACKGKLFKSCTLFFVLNSKLDLRNVKLTIPTFVILQYETNSDDVRRQFEEHGEIKTFFDLISTRGMVFVTYVSWP